MSRKTVLTILYVTLGLILLVAAVWIRNEIRSREKMKELQSAAEDESAPFGPELSDVEKARFSHLDGEHVRTSPSPVPSETPYGAPKEKKILPRFEKLHEENPDLAGWLTIPGTVIDYPVMYLPDDNDFYLKHDFEKKDDVNGLLVLDKRCRGDGSGVNSLIHGHHMKSGAMFGSLKLYQEASYFREHPVISYSTLYETREYEIFAVFLSSVYNEETTDFAFFDYIDIEDEESFRSYVEGAKAGSLYDTGVEVSWGDRLLTLSTCEYTKENGRLVVAARSRS